MLIGGWKITELEAHDYVALVLLCELLRWLHFGPRPYPREVLTRWGDKRPHAH